MSKTSSEQTYAKELYIQIINSSNVRKRMKELRALNPLNREDPMIQSFYNQEMIMLSILRGISEPMFEKALVERDKPLNQDISAPHHNMGWLY